MTPSPKAEDLIARPRALREKLSEAEAQVEFLRQRIAAAACIEAGHDWKHAGGRNAGCELGNDCGCSVPVHICTVCGDSDYGDNPEAAETIRRCSEERPTHD